MNMETPRHPRLTSVTGLVALVLACTMACSKADRASTNAVDNSPATVAASPAVAPIELTDETADVILTWIDDEGDFHVVENIAEVPEANRAQVRVVITTLDPGSAQTVYVADLRTKDAQGRYPVVTMDRLQWNELGADKRKVRMEALAPKAKAQEPETGNDGPGSAGDTPPGDGRVRAVVYGADWCKPCHDAEALLKTLGADVVKKDIEESRAAQAEMQQKLAKAGRSGASIPVIDVNGQLFVGFEPRSLTAAVEQARKRDNTKL
jgi:glutaredoxin